MKKFIITFIFSFIAFSSFANALDLGKDFKGTSGCFILFDLSKNKLLGKYNPTRCAERITPASTFKVPLSLMAFDQKIITQKTVFKWDGEDKGLIAWNQDQTPQTWLKNSAVWVSQELTPKLGLEKIKHYLKEFHYGNQDFSGDSNENNGLTHAWLKSSLKISADEQLNFMKELVLNKLTISKEALENTKENMFLETSPNGYKLYGKTGSAGDTGLFIGFLEKGNQKYIAILNFTDLQPPQTDEVAGTRAKNLVKTILSEMKLF